MSKDQEERGIKIAYFVLCVATLVVIASCRPPHVSDPDVLAIYDGGDIRVADVDTYLLSLPRTQRLPSPGEESQLWLTQRLSEIFEQRQLTTPERLAQLETDDSFQQAWALRSRNILARAFFRQHLQEPDVSTEEAQTYYDAHREEFTVPERRFIRNLLLAFSPAATEAQQQEI
jgi:hypothetical protein